MKILLRRNVTNVGRIGEVVDVKPGFARNYLIPQGIGYAPTEANIQRVEEEKAAYLAELAKIKAELEARAQLAEGKEVTITARANPQGHLYGSVGPAQVAAALAEEGVVVEPSNVDLHEPIRQLDKYDVRLDFGEEVDAAQEAEWEEEPGEEGEAPAAPAAGTPVEGSEGEPAAPVETAESPAPESEEGEHA